MASAFMISIFLINLRMQSLEELKEAAFDVRSEASNDIMGLMKRTATILMFDEHHYFTMSKLINMEHPS